MLTIKTKKINNKFEFHKLYRVKISSKEFIEKYKRSRKEKVSDFNEIYNNDNYDIAIFPITVLTKDNKYFNIYPIEIFDENMIKVAYCNNKFSNKCECIFFLSFYKIVHLIENLDLESIIYNFSILLGMGSDLLHILEFFCNKMIKKKSKNKNNHHKKSSSRKIHYKYITDTTYFEIYGKGISKKELKEIESFIKSLSKTNIVIDE